MVELSIIFGLYVIGSITLIGYLLRLGREERSELEDRLMALSKPEALISHKVGRDPQPAVISYMDEDGEAVSQRTNGHPDLIGDPE